MVSAPESEGLITFPEAPGADLIEWPGTPLGISDTITRTKSRTAVHDKSVDAKEGLLDKLLTSVREHIRRKRGQEVYQQDAIIHGVRVRAHTNNTHLYDFWVDNWYSPEEWKAITNREVEAEPRVQVYAFGGVENEKEAAYYSRRANTLVFFNTAYYGQLKSWVLGAVGRILNEDYGIHSIHGACVSKGGKAVLYIAPTGTGKSTASYGLMGLPGTRFHSDDWVYVRYTYRTRGGNRVSPISIKTADGTQVRGYQVYRWLEERGNNDLAWVTARDLQDNEHTLPLRELELSAPIEAYAYTSEKVFYLRTNLVENFPETVGQVLESKMENVPDVTPRFLREHRATLENLVNSLEEGSRHQHLFNKGREQLKVKLARLFAFENSRAMLDITQVFSPSMVFCDPMEPVKLTSVMLLKRNFNDDLVAESLPLNKFMSRLLIGETPVKTREIAYNAYRAVDDNVEKGFIQKLEDDLKEAGGPDPLIYDVFKEREDVPQTLWEEFELFRVMHQAAKCYDLNTILQKDTRVAEKREAVLLTMAIIERVLREEPTDLYLTLNTYEHYCQR